MALSMQPEQIARSGLDTGNAIRRRRRALGLTQGAVALRSGLRQATVSRIEAGKDDVRLSSIFSVLMVLDLEFLVRSRTKGPKIEDIF
jgi:HTH-type transcriptional regulator/antitoxin HipB